VVLGFGRTVAYLVGAGDMVSLRCYLVVALGLSACAQP
jgi:hypothetical protein